MTEMLKEAIEIVGELAEEENLSSEEQEAAEVLTRRMVDNDDELPISAKARYAVERVQDT